MEHDLKIEPVYFEQKLSGHKPWEIRKNDRNYKEGDILHLREWENGSYTGRELYQTIESLFQDDRYLQLGFVILTGMIFYDIKEDK